MGNYVSLVLEGPDDSFDLDAVTQSGSGWEALAGITGMGLPPVSVQMDAGAGDGAVFRGRRVQPRDIDLPLYLDGKTRWGLKDKLSRMARILDGEARLKFIDTSGKFWYLDVHRVGGGDYAYGIDTTGDRELQMVLTLRAGDPYWTYSEPTEHRVDAAGAGRGLLATGISMMLLRLAEAQAFGEMFFSNDGDAPAFPVWTVSGPATSFTATHPTSGDSFTWTGTLALGETLIVNTKVGSVVDGTGANRYDGMASAPRLWAIPPGESTGVVTATGVDPDSSITCSYRPRKWAVI